ncbi:MAG: STAS domain-containing protein [Limnohabitans sp.]|nr:STAS domain-containing protein [Limnohabitans sp.]
MALPAVLTQAQATAVAAQLEQAISLHSGGFVLDASALQQFDSSALAVLLTGLRASSAKGIHLDVRGLPARAQQLAQVYGLSGLLQVPADSSLPV